LIQFNSASADGYGWVLVGFRLSDGRIWEQGAVNDHGLAWDGNGLPDTRLNSHPEKTFSYATGSYQSKIMNEAATVEEAIQIARNFNFDSVAFRGLMNYQLHIADASGDAVVISAGPGGEIAYTRKPPGNGYLVSTNFNLAIPENGTKSWRFDKATALLAELLESTDMTTEDAQEVLREVRLEDLVGYTMYSNVFDLANGTIALNYMGQFSETIHLDIVEELQKGSRIVEMQDLFSEDTVAAGAAAYRQLEIRTPLGKIGALVVYCVVIGIILITVKKIKKSRSASHIS